MWRTNGGSFISGQTLQLFETGPAAPAAVVACEVVRSGLVHNGAKNFVRMPRRLLRDGEAVRLEQVPESGRPLDRILVVHVVAF